MSYDPLTLYVVFVVFVATLIRSTLGFGEALVAVPLLALRIPIVLAAPLAVLVSIVVAAAIVLQDWRRIDVRSTVGLVAATLVGILSDCCCSHARTIARSRCCSARSSSRSPPTR